MDFTAEQQQAIFTRGQDILVSAGAGAGKTRVLVTRITEMILNKEHPVPADAFLVLTFTNAAAREMKERIITELNSRLLEDPENRYLRQQIRAIKHADISTVHSFCNRLIRSYFHELGIDPSFRIGEDGELKIMKANAMKELLESRYEAASDRFLQFVEAYAPGKNDENIEKMIEKLYTFSRGFPDARSWFATIEGQFLQLADREKMQDSPVLRNMIDQMQAKLLEIVAMIEEGLAYFGEDHEPIRFYAQMMEDKAILEGILQARDFDERIARLCSASFSGQIRLKKAEKDYGYVETLKNIHGQVKSKVDEINDQLTFHSLAELRMEQKQLYPLFCELISLATEYEEIYSLMKKEKNIYDFDDLEHFALKLLVDHYEEDGTAVPSDKAAVIASRYQAIFVDEYQDTNLTQETLITILQQCGQAEIFTVGDVKQSIYRFRQARPDLFLARYHRYEKGAGLKIELRDNFRSSPDVLDFCNQFFERAMRASFGGIDYDENTKLRAGDGGPMADFREKQETILLLEDEEKDLLEEDLASVQTEAVMIAKRIEGLLEEGYRYEDMVILLRSMKGYGEIIADYLEAKKIPCVTESQMGYFQTREIRVMLNYLSIIDNVYQDIPMASVLLSSIGGFEVEDLGRMKLLVDESVRKDYSLYELMHLYLEEGEEESCKEKIDRFLSQLQDFRKKKQEMLLHELIWEIYGATGLLEQVLSMTYGEKRRRNLMVLLQKAEEYEKTMFKGLFHFIRYMEQLRSYEVEPGDISAADSVEKAVKIMTIHKSKGLEYPVVFVSLLSKKFNIMDTNEKILHHPVLGIGMEKVDLEERTSFPSMLKRAIRQQMLKETAEEELRILYVAMTRAQKKLILTGVVSQKNQELMEDTQGFGQKTEEAKCFLDWILPLVYGDGEYPGCSIYRYGQIESLMGEEEEQDKRDLSQLLALPQVADANAAAVKKSFDRVYPFAKSVQWKRKYSVSELKKLSMQKLPDEEIPVWEAEIEEEEIPKPAFLLEIEQDEKGTEGEGGPEAGSKMSGTDYGTMIHKVMELLPFGQIQDKKDLYEALNQIWPIFPQVTESTIRKTYRGAETFLFSGYGDKLRQMDREGRLRKELPFTIALDAKVVYPESEDEGEDRIVLQGIIDLCGEENGQFWLLDYKTDRIKEGEEGILLDRYKAQMLYYKLALEQMYEKKVSQTLIYSFALHKFIKIEW